MPYCGACRIPSWSCRCMANDQPGPAELLRQQQVRAAANDRAAAYAKRRFDMLDADTRLREAVRAAERLSPGPERDWELRIATEALEQAWVEFRAETQRLRQEGSE